MIFTLDETHSPKRNSFITSAQSQTTEFPIQNLPFAVAQNGNRNSIMVGIGDLLFNLSAFCEAHSQAIDIPSVTCSALLHSDMSKLMNLSFSQLLTLRHSISNLLCESSVHKDKILAHCSPIAQAQFVLPTIIGDYTDFYASYYHAQTVGKMFRPDQPLMPNYVHVPIGYHGRSSSIRVSPSIVKRPKGQIKNPDQPLPTYSSTAKLDFEVELGIFIRGGNQLGEPIPIESAEEYIFGYCLLNDWSARDIQSWEYQPLGPFLGKSFATTISPFVITGFALTPFFVAHKRIAGLPSTLPYLTKEPSLIPDISITASILSPMLRKTSSSPKVICKTNNSFLLWTPAQCIAHHSSNGCNLQSGDLLGTGTISGPEPSQAGSLLELTANGKTPIAISNDEGRTFLLDGDSVLLKATCTANQAVSIGFGEAFATIEP
ncbi:MAG: fumarylacetoacetase [Methylacidiphilales bacterium]|nr:fumarylacetoacetase [Candidatus Methylacidiphilales bacterium]